MAKPRTVEIRQINISMHAPHSPQAYVELFQKAYRLKRIASRGRSDGYLLGALYESEKAVEKNELQGEIYRFTNIDPDAPWFNTQTGKPADEADTENIFIPGNLHPNLERILFVFRPKEHRFWYISKDRKSTMGPSIAEGFLQQIFNEVSRQHDAPPVEVTVIPDETAVDEVLSIHRMTKIIFEFKRPNADDGGDVEQRIMRRMERRNINRIQEVMTSRDPEGIIPDEEMKAEAKAAANNGHVEAIGYDAAGIKASESTRAKPAIYPQLVDEKVETIWNVLDRASAKQRRSAANQ
ncbi:MAG: DUF4747 family protein [Comamonas sp.]